jgi:hypothetical protein
MAINGTERQRNILFAFCRIMFVSCEESPLCPFLMKKHWLIQIEGISFAIAQL